MKGYTVRINADHDCYLQYADLDWQMDLDFYFYVKDTHEAIEKISAALRSIKISPMSGKDDKMAYMQRSINEAVERINEIWSGDFSCGGNWSVDIKEAPLPNNVDVVFGNLSF